jgi:hypothetical protein
MAFPVHPEINPISDVFAAFQVPKEPRKSGLGLGRQWCEGQKTLTWVAVVRIFGQSN